MAMNEVDSRLWNGVQKGDIAKVLSALEDGAEADASDKLSRTPLMEAAKRGDEAVVSLLLRRGADINAQDSRGTSPLVYALAPENTKAIALLLEHGANATQPDKSGDAPLKLLKQKQLVFFLTTLFSIFLFVKGQLGSAKDKELRRSEAVVMAARLYEVLVTFQKYENIKRLLQKAVPDDD